MILAIVSIGARLVTCHLHQTTGLWPCQQRYTLFRDASSACGDQRRCQYGILCTAVCGRVLLGRCPSDLYEQRSTHAGRIKSVEESPTALPWIVQLISSST